MIAFQKPQAIGVALLSQGKRASYFPAQPLTENPNGVPSFSPGLAVQRPTPGKLSHKIQPLIPKPREARITIAANFPKIQNSTLKIQHCFPHPQANPHPKSTMAHPKSTLDLGCEGLIRVENGLRPPLSPTCYQPKSGPKIYSASLIIPASHSKCFLPFSSAASEEFQVKTRSIFRHPILPILTPHVFYRTQSRILIHRDFPFQSSSTHFKGF